MIIALGCILGYLAGLWLVTYFVFPWLDDKTCWDDDTIWIICLLWPFAPIWYPIYKAAKFSAYLKDRGKERRENKKASADEKAKAAKAAFEQAEASLKKKQEEEAAASAESYRSVSCQHCGKNAHG